jgi:hypothetical protein
MGIENLLSVDTPTVTLLPIVRGSDRELIFTTYESIDTPTLFTDCTGAQITFELKKKKEPNAANIVKKATTNAGGGDDQVLVNTSSNFTVFLADIDSNQLQAYQYWALLTIFDTNSNYSKVWVQVPFE